MRTFSTPQTKRRWNVIIDRLAPDALFDQTGTAILAAAWLARREGSALRIITQSAKARKSMAGRLFSLHGQPWDRDLEFFHADPQNPRSILPFGDEDRFLATSWTAINSIRQGVPSDHTLYLLQRDERGDYPHSEARLLCDRTMREPGLHFLVGTRRLFNFLVSEGMDSIQSNGIWFEPAFPNNIFFRDDRAPGQKRKFFFYARSDIPQHLMRLGMEAIESAITDGILDARRWEFYFAGFDFSSLQKSHAITSHFIQGLNAPDYPALLRTIDIGLALQYSPEPSYIPLQLAASGAVAVTNQYRDAPGYASYSNNILFAELNHNQLVRTLSVAANLSNHAALREENYASQTLFRSWDQSFFPLNSKMEAGWKNVFD
jgi:hypothetical protein